MAGARRRRPRAAAPRDRRPLRRVPALPRQPGRAAAAHARPRRARTSPRCARRRSTCSGRSPLRRDGAAHHRRVRVRHDRAARAAARRDDARHPPAAGGPPVLPRRPRHRRAGRCPRGEVLVPAGPFTMGTSTEPWALDNERPAHVVDVARVLDRHGAGHQRGVRRVRRRGRLPRPALVDRRRAGATAPRPGSSRPLFWARDADGTWWRRRFGRRRAGAARRAGGARVRARGRRLRRVGGRAAAHRGRMGEGGAARPGHRHVAPLPVGRRRPHARARQPRAAPPAARPGRAPTRRARRRWASSS